MQPPSPPPLPFVGTPMASHCIKETNSSILRRPMELRALLWCLPGPSQPPPRPAHAALTGRPSSCSPAAFHASPARRVRCPGLPRTRLPQARAAPPAPTTCPAGGSAVPGQDAGGRLPIARSTPPHWAPLDPGPAAGCRRPRASPPCFQPPASPRRLFDRATGGASLRKRADVFAFLRLEGKPSKRTAGSPSPQPRSGRGQASQPVMRYLHSDPSIYAGFSHSAGALCDMGTGAAEFLAMLMGDDHFQLA